MLLYVSGPYMGKGEEATERNIQVARKVAMELWGRGHAAICPHANTAHFERECDVTWEDYLRGDLLMIERCDGLVMLPGWENSRGAKMEKMHAEELGLPIWFAPDYP